MSSRLVDTLVLPLSALPADLRLPGPELLVVPDRPIEIRTPGSKSLTNRVLLIAGLTGGTNVLVNPLIDADDTRVMIQALEALGARVDRFDDDPRASELRVYGVPGRWTVPPEGITLNLQNAGTATRFLAASALLSTGPLIIDGNSRMRERPIGELGDALAQLGCTVEYRGATPRCPPVRITPPGTFESIAGATITLGRSQSSQFISGLLLTGICVPGGLTIRLSAAPPSESYVRMTLAQLANLGADVQCSDDLRVLRVRGTLGSPGAPCGLPDFWVNIEPDASSATYFAAAAALVPGLGITLQDIHARSLQGDAGFPGLLSRMGAHVSEHDIPGSPPGSSNVPTASPRRATTVRGTGMLRPILVDLSDMPDAAMTLASVACFASGTSVLRGLGTLRVKETDRIAAMQREYAKIGVTVATPVRGDAGAITITPPAGGVDCSDAAPPVRFDTYDDHRMAMSLSLIALRRPNIIINNPACVAKTYPGFWHDWAKLYAS